jgi:thioredoxin
VNGSVPLAAQQVEKQPAPAKKAEVIEIKSKEQLKEILAHSEGQIFVDFYSSRCGPCKMFAPIYEKWAQTHGSKITFLKVNADIIPDLFAKYGIQAVPTLLILDQQGREVKRYLGMQEIAELGTQLDRM